MDPLLSDLATRDEHAPVLSSPERTWSRGELRAATARVARALRRSGVSAGQRVAVEAYADPSVVALLLGVRAAGAVACPVDPRALDLAVGAIKPALVIAGR